MSCCTASNVVRNSGVTSSNVVPDKRSAIRDPYAAASHFSTDGRRLPQPRKLVVMGPCVRRDDEKPPAYARAVYCCDETRRVLGDRTVS